MGRHLFLSSAATPFPFGPHEIPMFVLGDLAKISLALERVGIHAIQQNKNARLVH